MDAAVERYCRAPCARHKQASSKISRRRNCSTISLSISSGKISEVELDVCLGSLTCLEFQLRWRPFCWVSPSSRS